MGMISVRGKPLSSRISLDMKAQMWSTVWGWVMESSCHLSGVSFLLVLSTGIKHPCSISYTTTTSHPSIAPGITINRNPISSSHSNSILAPILRRQSLHNLCSPGSKLPRLRSMIVKMCDKLGERLAQSWHRRFPSPLCQVLVDLARQIDIREKELKARVHTNWVIRSAMKWAGAEPGLSVCLIYQIKGIVVR